MACRCGALACDQGDEHDMRLLMKDARPVVLRTLAAHGKTARIRELAEAEIAGRVAAANNTHLTQKDES